MAITPDRVDKRRSVARAADWNLIQRVVTFGPTQYYYHIKPRRKTKIPAEERLRYLSELRANRPVIQRLVIDSNDCITDMCLIGGQYASDKSPLNT